MEQKKNKGIDYSFWIMGIQVIVFFGKASGFLHWDWLWVVSPIWLPVATMFIIYILSTFGAVLSLTVHHYFEENKRIQKWRRKRSTKKITKEK